MKQPKYIIADISKSDKGKSTFLNHVWEMIPSYTDINNGSKDKNFIYVSRNKIDIYGIAKPYCSTNGTVERDYTLGLNTQGDSRAQIILGFDYLSNRDCDIIICAARNEKALTEAVSKYFGIENKIIIITFSHFKIEPFNPVFLKGKSKAIQVDSTNLTRFGARWVLSLIEDLMS